MGGEGVEPSPPCREGILSPSCLPFHHPPIKSFLTGYTGIQDLKIGRIEGFLPSYSVVRGHNPVHLV